MWLEWTVPEFSQGTIFEPLENVFLGVRWVFAPSSELDGVTHFTQKLSRSENPSCCCIATGKSKGSQNYQAFAQPVVLT